MITIHIESTETNPCDDDRIIEPAKNPQTVLTRAVLGIVLILAVIIISLLTACAISAALAVYPFSYWIVRRKQDFWPFHLPDVGEPHPADIEKRPPTMRDGWGALLLGFMLFIAVFGFLILALS